MIGSLTKALKKVFGDKHQRDLKEVMPLVEEIKAAHASLTGTSNDELRARSAALKARIAQGTKSNDDRVAQLRSEIEAEPNMDIHEREERYQEIDKLEAESVGLAPFTEAINFPNPDFAALARACGGQGFTAKLPGDLEGAIRSALNADGPVIVDAVVAADEVPNVPHLEAELLGNFAIAKIKEAVLAVTG